MWIQKQRTETRSAAISQGRLSVAAGSAWQLAGAIAVRLRELLEESFSE